MSFDKPTRNRLQSLVATCRRALQADIEDQLQSRYGMYRADERIQPMGELSALSFDDQDIAAQLRDLFSHYRAQEPDFTAAYDRLVHEIGFTSLNRLVALRLAEERGFIVECVRKALDSEGFRIYQLIVDDQLGTPFETYRFFLHLIFDEMAVDLHFLFDRSLPQGLVFPSEPVLRKVLADLSAPDLMPLWKEDETIGWVYQFFNDPEERKRMREQSQAPRNSREMAVRNQFFTPRYVVEFLVDNTLGRTWIEMRQGNSGLKKRCQYLLNRKNEIFLGAGDEPTAEAPQLDATKEQILDWPFEVPFRAEKDPRDLKILDPACGSGHFLLYSFDLLELIYREAWNEPSKIGPNSVGTGKSLREDYGSLEELERALPGLILANNLFGVDIDPRAAQISAVALWLRAQRAYQEAGLRNIAERPPITRMNFVVAEAMPGEADLKQEFLDGLRPRVVAQVAEKVFEVMLLAGEAGVLLRVEHALADTLSAARMQWEAEREVSDNLFPELSVARTKSMFDVSDIDDDAFWDIAEETILLALSRFAETVEARDPLRRRLFADDSARGFAFIDICRKCYDAVVMNPPFGVPPESVAPMLSTDAASNIYPAFVLRGAELCCGFIGAITDRTFVVQQSFGKFRTRLISDLGLIALAELGWGVLDGADVQVATYFVRKGSERAHLFTSLSGTSGALADQLANSISESTWKVLSQELIRKLPGSAFAHSLPAAYLTHLESQASLRDLAELPRGLGSNDASRTYKAWYEVPIGSIGHGRMYCSLSNGGPFSPFYRDDAGVAEWLRRDGKLLVEDGYSETNKAYDQRGNPLYFKAGLSFPKQASFFNVSALPEDAIPTREGKGIIPNGPGDRLPLLAYLNSSYARYFVEATNGLHKQSGSVGMTPVPSFSLLAREALTALATEGWRTIAETYVFDEASRIFFRPAFAFDLALIDLRDHSEIFREIDEVVFSEVGVEEGDREILSAHPRAASAAFKPEESDALSYALGCAFGRWDIRLATGERPAPELPDPFAPLPVCPPGMLQCDDGLQLSPEAGRRLRAENRYPIDVAWDGILVDDPEHPLDLERRVRASLAVIWRERTDDKEQEACALLGVPTLREWFRRPAGFFADHLKRYSKSRRQAPIYWPLSTASGIYTVWIYYHRLDEQTLYRAVEDFVRPKLASVERERDALEAKLRDNVLAAGKEREQLQSLRAFASELADFRDELLRVAALPYRPDLNDGVVITAAPLRKLFRLKPWVKTLDEVWKKLEKGDYDWAHMAFHLWPDRVRAKCVKDRSLAIAHDLESICTTPDPTKDNGDKRGRKKKEAALIEEAQG